MYEVLTWNRITDIPFLTKRTRMLVLTDHVTSVSFVSLLLLLGSLCVKHKDIAILLLKSCCWCCFFYVRSFVFLFLQFTRKRQLDSIKHDKEIKRKKKVSNDILYFDVCFIPFRLHVCLFFWQERHTSECLGWMNKKVTNALSSLCLFSSFPSIFFSGCFSSNISRSKYEKQCNFTLLFDKCVISFLPFIVVCWLSL